MGGRGSSSKLSSKSKDTGAPWGAGSPPLLSDLTGGYTEERGKQAKEFVEYLINSGIMGTKEEVLAAWEEGSLHRSEADKKRYREKYGWEEYFPITLEERIQLWNKVNDDTATDIEKERFRNGYLESVEDSLKYALYQVGKNKFPASTVLQNTGKLGEGLERYYHGAHTEAAGGYGRGADARIKWDEKYGFSKMLDSHPELHYSTDGTLYRGLRLSDGSMKQLFKIAGTDTTMDFRGPSSWSTSEGIAEEFSRYSLVGKRNKNLVIFEEVGKGRRTAMPYYYGLDREVLYSGTSRFKVLSITQDEEGYYRVKVKEVKR